MNPYSRMYLLTAVGFVVTNPVEQHTDDNANFTVCNSTVCKARAKLVNASLNASVDPCDDFYSYVCGGWISNHTLPPSSSSYGIYDMLRDELQATLKAVLENMTGIEEEQTVIKNAKVMYNACVAVPTEPDRRDILLEILNASGFSQWPITNASSMQLKNVTQVLEVTGPGPILNLDIERDVLVLNTYAIQIDQPKFLKLGRKQLTDPYTGKNENITEAYKKLLEVAVKFVQPNITDSELTTVVCDIMVLERISLM
ncbi:neprilysin-1 [Rhipicephalus sanguineus]|uniref:neprilysin-1 n=1 Tax=Rhipicephalus sanguineus TaxID=34632 RepID=UPI0020C2C937|nr:neprilysin-1 [Rhipicephalus sanguineus]